MLRNIPLMLDITREVVRAVHTPVTVKTRLGWDMENLIICDLAEQLQDCGIQALTIHGRTRAQMYTGQADWTLIGEVKRNPRIHIPIIGNGDISTPQQALDAFERYGVDAVMIGRATFGRPWIFKEINDILRMKDERLYRSNRARCASSRSASMVSLFFVTRDASFCSGEPFRMGRSQGWMLPSNSCSIMRMVCTSL